MTEITRTTLLSDVKGTPRLLNGLGRYKVTYLKDNAPATVGDFINYSDRELLGVPNLGRAAIKEWRAIIENVGDYQPSLYTKEETESEAAEVKALKAIRRNLKEIAGIHKHLALKYADLADVIAPLGDYYE